MKRCFLLLIMVFCSAFLLFSQTVNRRYVAVQTVLVKSATGFFAPAIGRLSLGDEVTVLQESGKWSQVQSEKLRGWVASSSLSARLVVSQGAEASASEIAMAGKGLWEEQEIEYRKEGIDYSAVDFMESIVIPSDDLLLFVNDGHLAQGE